VNIVIVPEYNYNYVKQVLSDEQVELFKKVKARDYAYLH
jgi:hypothetical protein